MADGDCGGTFGLRCMRVGIPGGTTAEDHGGTVAKNWDGTTAKDQDDMMVEDHDSTMAEIQDGRMAGNLDGTIAEDHGGMMAENLVGKVHEEVDNLDGRCAEILDHMVFALKKVVAVQMVRGPGKMSWMCLLRGNRLACCTNLRSSRGSSKLKASSPDHG